MRGATSGYRCPPLRNRFQSTLPVRGATRSLVAATPSINPFQSTLPVRGATMSYCGIISVKRFQSTLPVRGATSPYADPAAHPADYFNPRSPCGERPRACRVRHKNQNFNPRSPCGERHLRHAVIPFRFRFQSTLPVRGATSKTFPGIAKAMAISIHAPRAGSDRKSNTCS